MLSKPETVAKAKTAVTARIRPDHGSDVNSPGRTETALASACAAANSSDSASVLQTEKYIPAAIPEMLRAE